MFADEIVAFLKDARLSRHQAASLEREFFRQVAERARDEAPSARDAEERGELAGRKQTVALDKARPATHSAPQRGRGKPEFNDRLRNVGNPKVVAGQIVNANRKLRPSPDMVPRPNVTLSGQPTTLPGRDGCPATARVRGLEE